MSSPIVLREVRALAFDFRTTLERYPDARMADPPAPYHDIREEEPCQSSLAYVLLHSDERCKRCGCARPVWNAPCPLCADLRAQGRADRQASYEAELAALGLTP